MLVTLVAFLAVIAHFFLLDRFPLFRTIWYALPRPVLALLMMILAAWWISQNRIPLGIACGLASVAFAVLWLRSDFVREAPLGCGAEESLRVVFWNVARPDSPAEIAPRVAEILSARPDIIGIVEGTTQVETNRRRSKTEAARIGETFRATWRDLLPGWEIRVLPEGMIVAAKHPIRLIGWNEIAEKTQYATVQVATSRGVVRVMLADVDGNPLLSRAPVIDSLLGEAKEPDEPVVIMGDFNLPRDSVLFDRFEDAGFEHAFDVAGTGNRSTWPVPLPVMALDHVWIRGLEPCRTRLESSRISDHKRIVVDLR